MNTGNHNPMKQPAFALILIIVSACPLPARAADQTSQDTAGNASGNSGESARGNHKKTDGKAASKADPKTDAKAEEGGANATPAGHAPDAKATGSKRHPGALANTVKRQGNILPKPTMLPKRQGQTQPAPTAATNASAGSAANLHSNVQPQTNSLNAPPPTPQPKITGSISPAFAQLPKTMTPALSSPKTTTPLPRTALPIQGASAHRSPNPAVIGGTVAMPNKKSAGTQGMMALGRP